MTRYTPLWLQAGSYAAAVDRRLVGALWPSAASTGCAVTLASGMTVNIAPGSVAVPTQNNTGTTLCVSDAIEQVTLAGAPASGQNRYDLIICQPRGNDLDAGANNDFIFTTVTGVAAATPTVPAVPAGAVALAQIYVPGGSASITAGNIVDRRPSGLAIGSVPPPTSYPRGFVAQIQGPVSQLSSTTAFTIVSLANVPVVLGRRYMISGSVNGSVAAGGTNAIRFQIADDQGGILNIYWDNAAVPTPASKAQSGSGAYVYTANATKNATFVIGQVGSGTAALTIAVNAGLLFVTDIGGT